MVAGQDCWTAPELFFCYTPAQTPSRWWTGRVLRKFVRVGALSTSQLSRRRCVPLTSSLHASHAPLTEAQSPGSVGRLNGALLWHLCLAVLSTSGQGEAVTLQVLTSWEISLRWGRGWTSLLVFLFMLHFKHQFYYSPDMSFFSEMPSLISFLI